MKNKKQESDRQEQCDQTDDYYYENGLVVFTKEFLLKRGYCCESGCRHCPYGFTKRE